MLELNLSLVIYKPNLKDLDKLFHSLSIQQDIKFKLYIWDNSPKKNDISHRTLDIDYRHGRENIGFGRGHNANFKRAIESEFFLVINPDIYFDDPLLFRKLINRMKSHPQVLLSSVRILNPDGSIQECHRLLPTFNDIFKRFVLGMLKIYKAEDHRYTLSHIDKTKTFICPNISGAFMLFVSNAFNELNGFDEGIFLYFEDIDISRRCYSLSLGTNTVFGELHVYHSWGRAGYKSFEIFKIHMLSVAYYFQKYGVFNDKFTWEANRQLKENVYPFEDRDYGAHS